MIRIGATVVAFIVGLALLSLGFRDGSPPQSPTVVEDVVAAGKAVPTVGFIIAFIDTSDSTANRSQALWVRSVRDQYETRGIRILVVQNAGGQSAADRRNVRYDWGLDTLTILPDPGGRLALAYCVEEFPTTVLLDDLGEPIDSWIGYSPPAMLASALERIADASAGPNEEP